MATPLWQRMARLNDHLSTDFLGGPRPLKMAQVINFQKAGTLPLVLILMLAYGNFSTEAWVYLALHGSYGLIWLLKDAAFPDPSWEKRVTIGGALMAFLLVLGPYWVFPFLLVSPVLGPRPPAPGWLLGLAIGLHTIGVVVMMTADCQKHFVLRERHGLIMNGMFARVRHPNYLGEMLLYGAYALVVRHWIPWAILAWVWGGVFLVNMLRKEASLARHPEWDAYRARTGMLLPRLGPDRAPERRAAGFET